MPAQSTTGKTAVATDNSQWYLPNFFRYSSCFPSIHLPAATATTTKDLFNRAFPAGQLALKWQARSACYTARILLVVRSDWECFDKDGSHDWSKTSSIYSFGKFGKRQWELGSPGSCLPNGFAPSIIAAATEEAPIALALS